MKHSPIKLHFSGKFAEKEVAALRTLSLQVFEENNLDSGSGYVLITIIDELCCNMMEHAEANWIEIELFPGSEMVKVVLCDDGNAFDPSKDTNMDYEAYLRSAPDRKLGLYMVKQLTDTFSYKRLDEGINQVTFEVKIQKDN